MMRGVNIVVATCALFGICCVFLLHDFKHVQTELDSAPASLPAKVAPSIVAQPKKLQMLSTKASWKPYRPLGAYYPEQIYLFAGEETDLSGHKASNIESMLKKSNPQTNVVLFTSLRVEQLRSVCWDEGTHVLLFPSFVEYPDIHRTSRADIKNYVSKGNNVVFLGGNSNIAVLNEIFGFHLQAVSYEGGPYYRSDRNAHNTPFAGAPSQLPEVGNVFGVHMKSLPPDARSYYDTVGMSVAFAVRQDLGMITYLGNDLRFADSTWHRALRAAVAL